MCLLHMQLVLNERTIVNCSFCNGLILLRPSRISVNKTGKYFCNVECTVKYRVGKNNPNYGKRHPGLNNGQKRLGMRGQNNPMFKKQHHKFYSGVKTREDLGHHCRSMWEANFCRVLKYLNIEYEYESISFEFKVDGKRIGYTPDIFIKKTNTLIEIKGYVYDNALEVIKEFQKQYPQYRLILIDETKYRHLKHHYSDIILNWEPSKEYVIEYRRNYREKNKDHINLLKKDWRAKRKQQGFTFS